MQFSSKQNQSSEIKEVTIKDKTFECMIDRQQIENAIRSVAKEINHDMTGKDPLFIAVLNGSFMFAAELLSNIDIPCEITFIRVSSYQGVESGEVTQILGLSTDIRDRSVIILEDIVDTGKTVRELVKVLQEDKPREIKIASFLFKPDALIDRTQKIDYVGIEIPSDFVVGYGLDYDGYGRNLNEIYKLKS